MVKSGYSWKKDEEGLTPREREALALVREGADLMVMAAKMGVTKQRAHQLLKALIKKGAVIRQGDDLLVKVRTMDS